MAKTLVAHNELQSFCQKLIRSIGSRHLFLLDGPLGVGKTQLVKTFVELYGGNADSPTFAVINEYSTSSVPVYHVDLYRLGNEADIESTGFWDLFRQSEGVVFVEWAQQIPRGDWPRAWPQTEIQMEFTDTSTVRQFEIITS